MLVYEEIKSVFIDDVNFNKIVDKIYDKYKQIFGMTSESHFNSLKSSIQYMRTVLDDKEIQELKEIATKYDYSKLPIDI